MLNYYTKYNIIYYQRLNSVAITIKENNKKFIFLVGWLARMGREIF
jgi:hypothetical protein